MIRVDQAAPDDCWRACLASILELRLEDVPHFVGDSEATWLRASRDWLAAQGYSLYTIGSPAAEVDHDMRDVAKPIRGGFTIWVGTTERGGDFHAVLANDAGELWHDPNPSRAGLTHVLMMAVVRKRG